MQFLGEQDGPTERILKTALVELFTRDRTVSRAYLVRVDFGKNEVGVLLALRTNAVPDEEMEIVKKVGAVFGGIFNSREHLDTIFLNDLDEDRLRVVCPPFFDI